MTKAEVDWIKGAPLAYNANQALVDNFIKIWERNCESLVVDSAWDKNGGPVSL